LVLPQSSAAISHVRQQHLGYQQQSRIGWLTSHIEKAQNAGVSFAFSATNQLFNLFQEVAFVGMAAN
jgi:hypothetical protein